LTFGSSLDELVTRRLLGGAGLARLLGELLLFVRLLAGGAAGQGDGRQGDDQERGEGAVPTHEPIG
jgi:hypothetical protein